MGLKCHDLYADMAEATLREDPFYRLAVIRIGLPPLREGMGWRALGHSDGLARERTFLEPACWLPMQNPLTAIYNSYIV